MNRRDFLKIFGVTTGAVILSACHSDADVVLAGSPVDSPVMPPVIPPIMSLENGILLENGIDFLKTEGSALLLLS